jgi:HAMP domain-containing protein
MLKSPKPMGLSFHWSGARGITIHYKILLGYAALIFIFALFGAYVYVAIQSINGDVHDIGQVFQRTVRYDAVNLDAAFNSKSKINDYESLVKDYLSAKGTSKQEVVQAARDFDAQYNQLKSNILQEQEAARQANSTSAAVVADLATMETLDKEYGQLQNDVARGNDLIESGQSAAAKLYYDQRLKNDFGALHDDIVGFQRALENRSTNSLRQFEVLTADAHASGLKLEETTLAALLSALVLALGASYKISNLIARPIVQIENAARTVEQGDYKPDILAGLLQSRDELGRLARVFHRMAEEVRARAEGFKSQISALHIEIDEIKRKKQVAEVVESDDFQDLRVKAKALRSQREGEQPDTNSPKE